MEPQKILFTATPGKTLGEVIDSLVHDNLFILCDTHTQAMSLPLLSGELPITHVISIEAGDTHKTLEALAHVWDELSRHGASRKSLLVNLGGGMVTDLGGFAAACFKRGIRFINPAHHAARSSRRRRRWENRNQLQRTEKRNRAFRPPMPSSSPPASLLPCPTKSCSRAMPRC